MDLGTAKINAAVENFQDCGKDSHFAILKKIVAEHRIVILCVTIA